MYKLLFTIFLFTSCSANVPENNKAGNDTLVVKNTNTVISTKRPALFNNQEPFTIKHITNTIEKNTTDKDTLKCNRWLPKQKDIISIIKNSKSIDGTQWDFDFEVLACAVHGVIIQNEIEYPFTTNAAAYSLINSGDTTVIFGDYNKQDRKLFLSFPQE